MTTRRKGNAPAEHAAPRGRPFTSKDARRGKGAPRGAENAGRPPSVIRETLRASFVKRIPMLERIADGEHPDATVADQIRAADMLAKYGLGTTFTSTDTEGNNPAKPAGVVILPAIQEYGR